MLSNMSKLWLRIARTPMTSPSAHNLCSLANFDSPSCVGSVCPSCVGSATSVGFPSSTFNSLIPSTKVSVVAEEVTGSATC